MTTKLRLLVLRTSKMQELKDFYQALGLVFHAEQHGSGPLHYAAEVGGLVLELYPLTEDGQVTSDLLRLGFSVDDLAKMLQELESSGTIVISKLRETPWGLRAVVRDPDGRAVELYQN
jgi:lactoylglutathione lyase